MEKHKINHSKIEGFSGPGNPRDNFSIIVKVNRADYIPPSIKLRERIDPYIFTADANGEVLQQLEEDPAVTSISINERLTGMD